MRILHRDGWGVSTVLALLATLVVAPAGAATFDVQGGIGFVAVSGAPPDLALVLEDSQRREVGRGTTDRFGSLIFRELEQRRTFIVRELAAGGSTKAVRTLEFDDHPNDAFYRTQTLVDGFQYIRTRDGTLLAAMVRPPLGKTMADGPFPTLIEYSGYSPADPDSPQPSSLLAFALGYATVGVNMRGSGCSGGVIDLFDLPTTADGYDIVETVAAQSWVKDGRVGMIGISFPGISQLYIGGARPPHLAALAPLSVIADIYRAPGFPGGIFNDGFAKSWLQERKDDARPAPEGGQGWAVRRVNQGDQTCRANQRLRLQTQDPIEFTQTRPYYEPALMDARSPINWVDDIQVPVFLASSWQDEQTGGDFASMLHRLPKSDQIKITVLNGVHSSTLEFENLWNWIAFLDLYVAKQIPDPSRVSAFATIVAGQILGAGAPTPPLPVDRYDGVTSYEQALQQYESGPRVRVLMENGAGSPTPGLPASRFELGFSQWPPREARPTAWYFAPDGVLTPSRGGTSEPDAFNPDPDVRPRQTLPGSGQSDSWAVMPPYDWRPLVAGTAVAYATPPLAQDVTIVGPSSLDLWLRSSAEDTDLQVTLTEIRPDGKEVYVQNGWLRASHRRLNRKTSTKLSPRVTHLERHAKPMPEGRFAKMRVELFAVAHVFRAGSRIRISIEAPGGNRTRWAFDTLETNGAVVNEVAIGGNHAARLVLPVIPGVAAPAGLPPCPGLRGQPCRSYTPATNGG